MLIKQVLNDGLKWVTMMMLKGAMNVSLCVSHEENKNTMAVCMKDDNHDECFSLSTVDIFPPGLCAERPGLAPGSDGTRGPAGLPASHLQLHRLTIF